MGLTGIAVEIGTHRADYAAHFYKEWQGKHLHCVDPWKTETDYYEQSKFLWDSDPDDREKDYQAARQKLNKVGKPYTMHKQRSETAALGFNSGSLDFVYLDGNHEYNFVKQDLELWFPKLVKGGVLAGHDFVCPGEQIEVDWGTQIQPALFEFATQHDLTIYIIVEDEWLPWSYYLIR